MKPVDALGHYVDMDHLEKGCIPRYKDAVAATQELIDQGKIKKDWGPELVLKMAKSQAGVIQLGNTCWRCGNFFYFSMDDEDALTIGDRVEPCTMPTLEPVVTTFTCRSGKVAVGNDFRRYFPQLETERKERPFNSINHCAGQAARVRHLAEHGYVTGYVSNWGVFVIETDEGIQIVEGTRDETDSLWSEGHPTIELELRWYAILDAEDLPEGATDSYDRPFVTLDLAPGVYDATYHIEKQALDDTPRIIWGTLCRRHV